MGMESATKPTRIAVLFFAGLFFTMIGIFLMETSRWILVLVFAESFARSLVYIVSIPFFLIGGALIMFAIASVVFGELDQFASKVR
ncbi:MAG: hypothetical protein ACHQ1H_00275 [Nitrososphaerales archaeon]